MRQIRAQEVQEVHGQRQGMSRSSVSADDFMRKRLISGRKYAQEVRGIGTSCALLAHFLRKALFIKLSLSLSLFIESGQPSRYFLCSCAGDPETCEITVPYERVAHVARLTQNLRVAQCSGIGSWHHGRHRFGRRPDRRRRCVQRRRRSRRAAVRAAAGAALRRRPRPGRVEPAVARGDGSTPAGSVDLVLPGVSLNQRRRPDRRSGRASSVRSAATSSALKAMPVAAQILARTSTSPTTLPTPAWGSGSTSRRTDWGAGTMPATGGRMPFSH